MNVEEAWEKSLEKKALYYAEGTNGYMIARDIWIAAWQARDEIAKQDEKELIEALIKICKITIKLQKELPPNTGWWRLVNENIDLIDIIEKHTGKTWEKLSGYIMRFDKEEREI